MGRIEQLPRSVYSSLQSGVYLFDLTRIVEELIYNSIDAGSTKVDVSLDLASCYVKVDDNGHGISRNDLLLLGERNATSKLYHLDDTNAGVETLGFRGETLSSLSDISLLEDGKSVYLEIDDNRQEVGTTVICHEIYRKQPVRRKYLLTRSKKVLNLIKRCVLHVALVQPWVAFKVVDIGSENELLSIHPSRSPLPLVTAYFGSDVSSTLNMVDFSKGELKLLGYLSSPNLGFSTKAFQFFYINTRFVSKGLIHHLLNNLTAYFQLNWKNKFRCGNRTKQPFPFQQTYPAYVLNLCCPISCYMISYESSKAVLKFKDWASIRSFTEAALRHFWGQSTEHLLQGESSVHKDDTSLSKANLEENNGVMNTSEEASENPTAMAKRYKVYHHNEPESYLSPLNDFVSTSILSPSFHERVLMNPPGQKVITGTSSHTSKNMISGGYGAGDADHGLQIQNIWQNDIILSCESSNASLMMESPLEWADESIEKHHISRLKWTECSSHVDSDSDSMRRRRKASRHEQSDYEKVNGKFALQSNQNKRLKRAIPAASTCLEDMPNKSRTSSSHRKFEGQFDGSRTEMEWPSFSEVNDYAHLESCVGNLDFFGNKKLQGQNSSHLLSFNMTKDDQTTKSLRMFRDDFSYPRRERHSRKQTYSLESPDASSQHVNDLDGLYETIEVKHYHSSLCSDNVELNTKNYHLHDEYGHRSFMCRSFNETKHAIGTIGTHKLAENSFNEDWLPNSSSKSADLEFWSWFDVGPNIESFRGSALISGKNASSEKYYSVNKTRDRTLNHNGEDKGDRYSSAHAEHKQKEPMSQYYELEHMDNECTHYVSKLRTKRSCSAPPHYPGKRKFSVLTSPPAATAACCRRKCLEQKYFPPEVVKQVTLSTGHPYIRKCTDEQHYTNMNKRKLYLGNCSFTEAIEGTLPTKWRNGEPESEEDLVNDVMMIENKHSASSDCLDGVLNISSGLLYLSGSCLVPESISKDYLEAAKVLQQLDRKFIPITAGGVLAVVDQHAADERIRLEELHQNVLSGKGKSISYLEYGKELVLPEFGFQLLQNYTDQIRRWGWICDIHAENMCSFTRNLNILHQQAVKVTLIAVPCILGINLSDKDLLEFLDQLVDTDGSSSIPPAVLRILNYKACRGAIMFGDTLLPSECSLIVDELKRTSLCFQCAHGRPTTVPLVNLEALHEQLNRLNSSGSGATESWHGLRRYEPSLERAKARLAAARNCG
ncbi:DNA mismatch repair protein MLH3 isoform X2 [Nymphaea colorata]|uniref:DNA mismatch repair protein MLH3 isoform X2 n=1 Tax=Nymphaea colorata TaxID=210225 RepID=UPI00214E0FC5|nr:DNA mismatch repair protein MLH3 isoform X2 [Nymphaea colorata]